MNTTNKSTIHEILDNGLTLKEFFLKNGISEVKFSEIDKRQNSFHVESVDHDNGLEYTTNVSDFFILSFIFDSYSKKQINEIVSFLNFYEQLFFIREQSTKNIETHKNSLMFDNGWLLIYVSKKDNSKKISIDFNKYSTFFQNTSFKNKNFEELMNSLKSMFTKAVRAYYNKNNIEINTANIQGIINESLQDYDQRINSKGLYDINYFNIAKDNIKKSSINYEIIKKHDENKCIEFLNKHELLISRSQNEDTINSDIDNTKYGLKYIFKKTKYKTQEIILENIFNKENITYITNIISLLSFINTINNDFSNNEIIDMYIDKFSYDSKDNIVSHNTIIYNQVGNFRFNIGRTIEIYYFNESSYSRKSNGSIVIEDIRNQSSFKVVYDKLLKDFIKKISISQELKPKNLKFNNILLEHMQNY